MNYLLGLVLILLPVSGRAQLSLHVAVEGGIVDFEMNRAVNPNRTARNNQSRFDGDGWVRGLSVLTAYETGVPWLRTLRLGLGASAFRGLDMRADYQLTRMAADRTVVFVNAQTRVRRVDVFRVELANVQPLGWLGEGVEVTWGGGVNWLRQYAPDRSIREVREDGQLLATTDSPAVLVAGAEEPFRKLTAFGTFGAELAVNPGLRLLVANRITLGDLRRPGLYRDPDRFRGWWALTFGLAGRLR